MDQDFDPVRICDPGRKPRAASALPQTVAKALVIFGIALHDKVSWLRVNLLLNDSREDHFAAICCNIGRNNHDLGSQNSSQRSCRL